MPSNLLIAIIIIMVIAFSSMFFSGRMARNRFENREQRGLNIQYDEYCVNDFVDKEVFCDAFIFLSKTYQVELGKLRLNDSFKELRLLHPIVFWDMETDIEEYIEKKIGDKKSLSSVRTIRDFVAVINKE